MPAPPVGVREQIRYSEHAYASVKRFFLVAVILLLGLSLAAGENHNHQQTASCPGCLHAPVLIDSTKLPLTVTLIDFGVMAVAASPQPRSCLFIPLTLLRAPPLV